jgi:hypothetical protein
MVWLGTVILQTPTKLTYLIISTTISSSNNIITVQPTTKKEASTNSIFHISICLAW